MRKNYRRVLIPASSDSDDGVQKISYKKPKKFRKRGRLGEQVHHTVTSIQRCLLLESLPESQSFTASEYMNIDARQRRDLAKLISIVRLLQCVEDPLKSCLHKVLPLNGEPTNQTSELHYWNCSRRRWKE